MLTIFMDRNVTKDIVDIEKAFAQLKIKGTPLDRKLIERIEKGKYNDKYSYIDRFGYKLRYEDMSTGCKAALCVANIPDQIIDLIECGINARDVIIATCMDGKIVMGNVGTTISTQYGTDIQVKIDHYLFTDKDRLNKYIKDEMPFKPDISLGGVVPCM